MNKMLLFIFFILHMHTKFQENQFENSDLLIFPPNPRSKLETLPKMEKAVTQKGNYRLS